MGGRKGLHACLHAYMHIRTCMARIVLGLATRPLATRRVEWLFIVMEGRLAWCEWLLSPISSALRIPPSDACRHAARRAARDPNCGRPVALMKGRTGGG